MTRKDTVKFSDTPGNWKGEQFWPGKLLGHPEIMPQGKSLEELEENLRDACRMMVLEVVPEAMR